MTHEMTDGAPSPDPGGEAGGHIEIHRDAGYRAD
jgi:hypothetical protein